MEYTAIKIDGQNLMYRIETIHNANNISFNVVCAENESELDLLVQHHLDFLDSGPTIIPSAPTEPQVDSNTLLLQMKNELDALKAKIAALESGS